MKKVDFKALRKTCTIPMDAYRNPYPGWELIEFTPTRFNLFQDNGADILAVAHLDTVNKEPHFYVLHIKETPWVLSTGLDDRLGVYTLLNHLPAYGLKYDILLTTDEETGRSTGNLFNTTKKYKWMFECDRRGEGAVHYQYTDKVWLDAIGKHFNPVDRGSGTDISHMDHLGICGVNFGVGYHNEHDTWASCNLNEYYDQIARIVRFYNEFKNKTFSYVKPPVTTPAYTTYPPYSGGGHYKGPNYTNTGTTTLSKKEQKKRQKQQKKSKMLLVAGKSLCANCGKYEVVDTDVYANVCADCFARTIVCEICNDIEDVSDVNVNEGYTGFTLCTTCIKDLEGGRLVLCKEQYCTTATCKQRLWNKEFVDGGICGLCEKIYLYGPA